MGTLILMLLVILVFLAGLSLRKKNVFELEKISPFECGFTPKYNARLPFSIRFFLIALVFLVFDVELVLIFPFILSLSEGSAYSSMLFILVFIIVLTVGVSHEWNQGRL